MHRIALACLVLIAAQAHAINVNGACPVTVGTLTPNVSIPRATCISPCLVFFDATGTTDTAITGSTTVFQDVTYTWNFGDTLASGTSTWAYGARPGVNVKNKATGGIAAHLYVTQGRDTKYTATVTATNGTNTAVCGIGVTVYNPSGANGFPGAATTCVSASGTPVAGVGGCPVSATVLNTSSFNTALGATYFGNSKRVLFKCGDTFTGDNAALNATTWSVGAYGGCEGTQTNRPIFSDTTAGNQALSIGNSAGDGRISDIDFEGGGTGNSAVSANTFPHITYQITLYNLLSNGNVSSFGFSQGAQWGVIGSAMTGMGAAIGVFFNFNANNPPYSGNVVNNLNYSAALGNSFNGVGAPNNGQGNEVLRLSACRMCVIENNTIQNANNVGALLKLHNGNTNNSCAGQVVTGGACFPCTVGAQFATTTCWTGAYTELVEISDNLFTGTSGANVVETAPENANDDERLRNIVVERNIFATTTGAQGGRLIVVSAVNETLRDNIFYMQFGSTFYPIYAAQLAQRAMEPAPTGLEIYNNTCYNPVTQGGQSCIGISGSSGFGTPAANSFAKNNLYFSSASSTTVTDIGTGNAVSNNTVTPTVNPSFTNGSGTFSLLSDFKPTANYTGGVSVPVQADALGIPWSPWDLGAVHH
jgi:hypothetical protein